jgi:hypothetical protein
MLNIVCVPLKQGSSAWIDEKFASSVLKHNWHIHRDGCVSTISKETNNKRVWLHRLIFTLEGIDIEGKLISHINGNKLDNRLSNLTITVKNKKLPSSGFRGVHKHHDSWRVILLVDGKRIRVCGFKNPEIAARKYDELAKLYYGDSAILNFPRE